MHVGCVCSVVHFLVIGGWVLAGQVMLKIRYLFREDALPCLDWDKLENSMMTLRHLQKVELDPGNCGKMHS